MLAKNWPWGRGTDAGSSQWVLVTGQCPHGVAVLLVWGTQSIVTAPKPTKEKSFLELEGDCP